MEGHLPKVVFRSLLTLLITVAFAMAGMLLTVSASAGARECRIETAPQRLATVACHGSAFRAQPKRMYAERARGQIFKAHREVIATASWQANEERQDDDQLVPGSGLGLFLEEEGGSPGDALVSGSVETRPAGSAPADVEHGSFSRPRTISRTVDVPPPRRR